MVFFLLRVNSDSCHMCIVIANKTKEEILIKLIGKVNKSN